MEKLEVLYQQREHLQREVRRLYKQIELYKHAAKQITRQIKKEK